MFVLKVQMSSCQRSKWVKRLCASLNELQKAEWKQYLISVGVHIKYGQQKVRHTTPTGFVVLLFFNTYFDMYIGK